MTVVMKIDLVGPRRRGLALGLNESAGYLGVAAAALATGALAATYAPRTIVWVGAAVIAVAGTLVSVFFVRDTGAHVDEEQRAHGARDARSFRSAFARGTLRDPVLRACSQAGLVNNLNDALAWGLAPLYLAANGASVTEVGIVAGVYPAVWGAGQLLTGWLSDHTGRKPLIVLGMLVQAGALALLVAGGGAFAPALGAAILLGAGTALVYPTLIAAVSDVAQPVERAQLVGVYRFWRDFGFVVGAVIAGVVADGFGADWAIAVVAALTAASGLWVALTRWASATSAGATIGGRSSRRGAGTDRASPRARRGSSCDGGRCSSRRPSLTGRAAPSRGRAWIAAHSALGARVASRSRLGLRESAHHDSRLPARRLLRPGLLLELRRGEPARAGLRATPPTSSAASTRGRRPAFLCARSTRIENGMLKSFPAWARRSRWRRALAGRWPCLSRSSV